MSVQRAEISVWSSFSSPTTGSHYRPTTHTYQSSMCLSSLTPAMKFYPLTSAMKFYPFTPAMKFYPLTPIKSNSRRFTVVCRDLSRPKWKDGDWDKLEEEDACVESCFGVFPFFDLLFNCCCFNCCCFNCFNCFDCCCLFCLVCVFVYLKSQK